MYLCGQSMLCTATGCETASSVLAKNKFVYKIHHSKGSGAKQSRPWPVSTVGLRYERGQGQFLIITSSSFKIWASRWSAWLAVWFGQERRGDNKAGVFTVSCCFGCVREGEGARERESTSIRLSRSMPSAWSREHSRMQEDHTKEGASLVGGHQRKRFSLSRFQERAHFPLFPLTPFLMLYSSACPPWTSVYCCLPLAPLKRASWGFLIGWNMWYSTLYKSGSVSFSFN